MPSLDLMISFFIATSIFAYMPGPALLYTAAQTIACGPKAGWFAALGIHIGGYVHVIAAAVGLAVLFEAVPTLYLGLKLAGAGYLVWLGVTMFLANQEVSDTPTTPQSRSAARAFWQSVSVEVLNPKTAIFFVAFLPQFADPAASFPIWLQLLILGTLVNFMFSSADAVCVMLADRLSALLKTSGRANRLAQRLGGGILVALGTKLALEK
ncbi:LysE family translocator [Cognatishimia sp.]|uniref:LysE family translocator n=1 Tax=Cognatishimia sp. TaxID=2211648 RepID=UPI003513AB90